MRSKRVLAHAGMDGGRERRPGHRPRLPAPLRQGPRYRRARHLHLGRLPQRLPADSCPSVTQDLAEDSWVLGQPIPRHRRPRCRDTGKLRRDVIGLYLDDYTRRWDAHAGRHRNQAVRQRSAGARRAQPAFGARLAVARPADRDRRADPAQPHRRRRSGGRSGAGQGSPVPGSVPPGLPPSRRAAALPCNRTRLPTFSARRSASDPSGKPVDPAKRVDDHFKTLHDFVTGADGTPSGLEVSLQKIQQLYQNYDQVANAPNQGQVLLNQIAGGGGGMSAAAAQLQDLHARHAQPVADDAAERLAQQRAGGEQRRQPGAVGCLAYQGRAVVRGRLQPLPAGGCQQRRRAGGRLRATAGAGRHDGPVLRQVPQAVRRYHAAAMEMAVRRPHAARPVRRARWSSSSAPHKIRDALFANGNQVQVRFQLVPIVAGPGRWRKSASTSPARR